jgi:hypothetical protein
MIALRPIALAVLIDFNKSIVEFPGIKRAPGGVSIDLRTNLQNPENPLPLVDMKKPPKVKADGG